MASLGQNELINDLLPVWCQATAYTNADIVNSLRPRQNEHQFSDGIFKCIFFNENVWISIKISLKFVPKGPIDNIPALVEIMAWHRPGDKPLSELIMISLLMHICVTRPQWVNWILCNKRQEKFESNTIICIQENALQNVICKMLAILFRP